MSSPPPPAFFSTLPGHSFAVVDMGSNGIRFSIFAGPYRHLPLMYKERVGISLYKAQEEGVVGTLPVETLDEVERTFARFKRIVNETGTQDVTVVGTETSRIISNPEDLKSAIRKASGWEVDVLSPEEEAKLGALGVSAMTGITDAIIIDMGGGSIQLSRLAPLIPPPQGNTRDETEMMPGHRDGDVQLGGRVLSLPLGGAAAMTAFSSADGPGNINRTLDEAIPPLLASWGITRAVDGTGPRRVYLSGGSARALGYLILNASNHPLPSLEGYVLPMRDALSWAQGWADGSTPLPRGKVEGVSKRRASQLPAILTVLARVLALLQEHGVEEVGWSLGGTQEGVAMDRVLSPEERSRSSVEAAAAAWAWKESMSPAEVIPPPVASHITSLIGAEAVNLSPGREMPSVRIVRLAIQMGKAGDKARAHVDGSKALYASRFFLPEGEAGGWPGLGHGERAALSLILQERWGGLAKGQHDQPITRLLSSQEARKCRAVGKLLELIFRACPITLAPMTQKGVALSPLPAAGSPAEGKKTKFALTGVDALMGLEKAHVKIDL